MIKNTAQYSHSLTHMAVIIPAAPRIPVIMRCVRLLYFKIDDFTDSLNCTERSYS